MNEKFYALPAEKQQRIISAGFYVFSQKATKALARVNPEGFIPGLDLETMYRQMFLASEGYLWEMMQQGSVDWEQIRRDFTKLLQFWKSTYCKKENCDECH